MKDLGGFYFKTATIQNEKVIVTISDKGAELQSVRLKEDNTEYLWQGDSTYWGRRAPISIPYRRPIGR